MVRRAITAWLLPRTASRRFFPLEAIDMGGARCVGSVYGALRGRACQGQQLDGLGRNTGLQVLSGWASCLLSPGAPGALRTARAPVSPVCGPQGRSWGPGRGVSGVFRGRRAGLHSGVRFVGTSLRPDFASDDTQSVDQAAWTACLNKRLTNERAAVRLTPGYSHADSDHRRSPTQSAGRGTQKRAQH